MKHTAMGAAGEKSDGIIQEPKPVFSIVTGEPFKQSAELTGEPIKMKA